MRVSSLGASSTSFPTRSSQDNADLRLTEWGHAIGVVGEKRYEAFQRKKEELLRVGDGRFFHVVQ